MSCTPRYVQKLNRIDVIAPIARARYRIAGMRTAIDPFSFLVTSIAGWMNEHQHHVIDYLMEENRVLREQIGNRRLRFSDDQRRRLAAKARKVGRKILAQVATIVTPETLLAWHRKLIAKKYDGSGQGITDGHEPPLRSPRSLLGWQRRIETGVI